jgi:Domain of unknown function (DUF4263)
MPPKQGEYLKKSYKSKDVFFYRDEREDLDIRSRVVYKTKSIEVHFPFNRNGSQKYKYIRSIEFHDISPTLVPGIYTAVRFGLGFTRNLSPIAYRLETLPSIRTVKIFAKRNSGISGTAVIFNTGDLSSIFRTIRPFKKVQAEELRRISNNTLAEIFPNKFKNSAGSYTPGELSVFLKDKKIGSAELSNEDLRGLIQAIPEYVKEEKIFYQAEEKIEFIKLTKVRREFQKLVEQRTDTEALEEKCQRFFKENHWILSNILSMPVVLLGGKLYVGGKGIDNSGGREADFLFKNKLTENIFIIEIKTPLKKIIGSSRPYRTPDVFSIGKEVTGGLVQALDQKDSLQKEFYHLAKHNEFTSFNPKVVLIVGNLARLKTQQLKSFELFRSSIRDVEIITYDELLNRTDLILGQFVKKSNRRKNSTAKSPRSIVGG